jgi:4'-phosphopantetheinyl transferase
MIEWPTAPDPCPLQDHGVHVWAVELDDQTFRDHGWLSPDERNRADRFKFSRHRRRYVIAHTALREILSGSLGVDAGNLEFVEEANGKPQLAARFAGSGIAFNLSHSHEQALIAVARGREVGVDIEFAKADFAFNEVAERFFTAKEVAALGVLPGELQRQAFYKCWTSKEAFLKAKGTGLSGKLDEVEITLGAEGRIRIGARVPGWSLSDLNPGEGYEAALVVAGQAGQIQTYRWQPGR